MAEEREIDKGFDANEKVGDYLRRMREAHKIELKQMAKFIRLSEEILHAIEENRWSYFKIDAYLRCYIVAICDKMSLDKSEVLRRLSFERNSLSSMVVAPDKPEQGTPSSDGGGSIGVSGGPQVKIAIALIVVAALFFIIKVLGSESDSSRSSKEDSISGEEQDIFPEDAAHDAEQDSLAATDSVAVVAKREEIKIDSSAIDTLRFECTPAEADSTCGISLKGLDTKIRYFRRMERRYITRGDTSQITITVPLRTRLFLNNERLDYNKVNTVLFYNGEILKAYSRELR